MVNALPKFVDLAFLADIPEKIEQIHDRASLLN
jgi:hypothetical protein